MRWVATLLLLAGCKSTERLETDAPDSLRFVAIVEVDEDGAFVRAGPLTPWAADAALPVVTSAEGTLLVGYDEATLAAAGLLEAARADDGATRLDAAVGCLPALPEATWLGAWRGEGVVELAVAEAPALTARWAADTCPGFSPDFAFDVPCREKRCAPTIVDRDNCSVTVSLSCADGSTMVRVDPLGRVCAELSEDFGACTLEASRGGVGRHACPECRVDVHAFLDDRELPIDAEVFPLVDVETRLPDNIVNRRQPFRSDLYMGWVLDFVVLEDTIVVAAPAQDAGYGDRCAYQREQGRRLLFLDPDDLVVDATRETEDCLIALAAEPNGRGFVGVFGSIWGTWSLGRFDETGALVASAAFDSARFGSESDGTIHQTFFSEDGETIVVLLNISGAAEYGAVRTFRADTLEPIGRYFTPPRRIEFGVVGSGRTILVFEPNEVRTWLTMNLDTGAFEEIAQLPNDITLRAALFATHEQDGMLLAGGRGHGSVTGVLRPGTESWAAIPYEAELHVFGMTRWPADPDLVLAVGGIFERYIGGAALLDPRDQRFLPGVVRISDAAASIVRPDGRGGVLALLPWSGEIARLRAAP